MNTTEIVKHILEGDEDFDPREFVKNAVNRESAVEIYNGPLVRVIQPLSAFTVNNYVGNGGWGELGEWDDSFFKAVSQDGPLYLAVDKADHDNFVMFQPTTGKVWNNEGREQDWKSIPELISSEKPQSKWEDAKNPNEDKNWLDLQQGLATFFMAQIAKKKNVGQWVKFLTMIGRTDLATNYARYLGRAKLPFGKSVDAVLAMKKAGKRSRNRIARLMKSQKNVKWGERGFWLLFDDWADLAPFYGEGRNQDYKANAEKIFGGDTHEWFDQAETKPEEVWDSINDNNMSLIRQLLVNRTVYNSDGEEHLVTKENVDELDDGEIKDIVCDRGNKNDAAEDIYDAIRWAANDAYVSQMEGAYYEGYRNALMKEWGLQEDKTIKWIPVGKKEPDKKLEGGGVQKGHQKTMLGIWFPYSTLEQWIAQWKEDEYEDDYYGDIHDLAAAYLEKVTPNDEYWGDMDSDYFNEQLDYHLNELELTAPEKQADPNQPELPLEGEPDPQAGELEKNYTVTVGQHPDEKVYKGVRKSEATKYREAMKPTRDDISFRAESFLAIPLDRIDERLSDKKIEFEASDEAAESLVPLLKELRKMGSQGSSRNIKIEDWDGKSSFGFDGDGASKIGEIKVDGQVVEARGRRGDPPQPPPDPDPKAFVMARKELYLPQPNEVAYDVDPLEEDSDFHGHFASDEPELDRQLEEWIERQLEMGNQWAWCTARVTATWTDPMLEETFHGYAYLGGCNYKSKKDFCHPQGYFPQMKDEAYEDLIQNIERRRAQLGESQVLQEAIYKLSTTQIDLPKEIGQHIISWGELNIADEDLYIDEKDGCGRETEQHVTVLYGLTDQTPPEALVHIVESTKPFLIEFGGVSIFENPKYDVVKLDVISEELHNLHLEIRRSCPNENKFPDYKPHCTIAYVKKGTGKKYAGVDVFKTAQVPRDFWAYDLLFKGAGDSEDGNRVVQLISFDKSKDFERDEPKAGEQRYPQATREEEPAEEPELAVAESAEDDAARAKLEGHLKDIGLEPVDPKEFLDAHAPAACPQCHSHNLSETDEEGLVDCLDCGIWFDPLHPDNQPFKTTVGEADDSVDPKQFTERPELGSDLGEWKFVDHDPLTLTTTYIHENRGVQFTLAPATPVRKHRWRVHVTSVPDGSAMSDWEDFRAATLDEAQTTAANIAYTLIHNTDPGLFRVQEAADPERKWKGMTKQTDELAKTDPLAATAMAGGGTLIRPPLPSREKWNAMLAAYAPGCGSPTPYPGTGSKVPCGATVEGRQFLCPHCEPKVQEAEEINAKEFLNRTTNYRIRRGVGPQTKYLNYDIGTGAFKWVDFDDASLFDSDKAGEVLNWIGDVYGGQRVVAELAESEIDTKTFIAKIPHHELQQWDEAGPEGGYQCSCGQWRYKLTGWSSSIPNAMKEFQAHKRLTSGQPVRENDMADPKSTAMRVPTQFVVQSDHNPPEYLAIGLPDDKTYVYQTSDRTRAKVFGSAEAEEWAEHLSSPHRTNPRKPRPMWTAVPAATNESVTGPFDDDGLPGEVSSFLRKVRSKRPKKRQQPII